MTVDAQAPASSDDEVGAFCLWGQRGVGAYDPGVEPTYRLTPRQKQVLELVACGLGGKEIATQLGVSHQTIRNHFVGIHRALGALSSSHAVKIAIERKLIDHCQDDEPVIQRRTGVVAVVFLICQEDVDAASD